MAKHSRSIEFPTLRHHIALLAAIAISSASVPGCHRGNSAATSTTSVATTPPIVPVTVVPVEPRPVQRRISVVGSLYGFEQVTITPQVEGRVQAIHFDVGDRVPAGTTLLDLDPVDYRLAVEESQRSLEQELSKLDLSAPPVAELDIEQLPTVQRARLLLENAQRQFERFRTLIASKATPQQNYEQAETDLKVADATLRQARIEARTTLAAVKQRQALLALAQQQLSETAVKCPSLPQILASGQSAQFTVSKRMVSVGEIVRAFPSTPVFELVVDDVLKLHVMVPERYLPQVETGLEIEVRVEAYPNEVFPGKVVRINPTVDPQSRSFDVEAHIPNPDRRLKHGGFAKADVIVQESAEALTIPIDAVRRFAGVSKVFRVRDDTAEEVEVTIGTQGPGWIEVLGQLSAGDLVVTSGQSRLANGTRVVVREQITKSARRN